MRKKPNLIPRMARCEEVWIKNPQDFRGRWREAFPGYDRIWLELGCGKGRFTAETAKENPDVLFIALEKVPDAMVTAMERVMAAELKNVYFISGDAAHCLEYFAPGEINTLFINFCDPWPRRKEAKRRLTAPGFLTIYENILTEDGELRFKTDNNDLFDYSVETLGERRWNIRFLTRDLHENGPVGVMTDYEMKFHQQGVKINCCVAERPAAEVKLCV